MHEPTGDTKGPSGRLRFLVKLAGGMAGAAIGWHLAEVELSRFAAKVGMSSQSLGADNRGPALIGCFIAGWIVGSMASGLFIAIWCRIRLRILNKDR
jgi:hypothetical protein